MAKFFARWFKRQSKHKASGRSAWYEAYDSHPPSHHD